MSSIPAIAVKSKPGRSLPIHVLHTGNYAAWLKSQPATVKRWLEANAFKAAPHSYCLFPDKNGAPAGVACGSGDALTLWSIAHLPAALPDGAYHLEGPVSAADAAQLALGWALACYQFTRYRKRTASAAVLHVSDKVDLAYVRSMADAVYWARDLINTPANDMNPDSLSAEAAEWAKKHKGRVRILRGEALLKANYPLIYTVGKASSAPPCLVDILFARKGAPKVTLVGKGVCFDSGGLDIKSSGNMKLMKKDMGGAACVLALARVIIAQKLPVQLRVLLPIVENAVSGNAMRPLDIVPSRKGITVEIGNTDAEGRLILCDALYEAGSEAPDLLIDCATLTGAARTALGTEIPAFFTPDDALASELAAHSMREHDPLWRLPLWSGYRRQLDSPNADLSNDPANDPDSSFGGAITAALYLQEFVGKTPSWLHVDMMAWNLSNKPGRPQGGEAMAIRAIYALLKERYGNTH